MWLINRLHMKKKHADIVSKSTHIEVDAGHGLKDPLKLILKKPA